MRLQAVVLNPTVNWRSQFVLGGISNPAVFDELPAWLLNQYDSDESGIVSRSEHQVVLRLPYGIVTIERTSARAFTTDISESPPEPGDTLVIDLPHMSSGYRDAVRTAEDHVIPLLTRARQIGQTRRSTYVLTAQFPSGNPYFGLYVRRLGALRLDKVEFDIRFSQTVLGTHRNVTVRKNELEVAADDISGFQTLVHSYLAIH